MKELVMSALSLVLTAGVSVETSLTSEKLNDSVPTRWAMNAFMYSPFLYPHKHLQPVVSYTSRDLRCLTDNLYHEARGEGLRGMRLVGDVTINRALSSKYPNNVCSVVYQRSQFSWTSNPRSITEHNMYSKAKDIAKQVLYRDHDLSHGSLFFYAHNVVTPGWRRHKTVMVTYRNHTFLR